MSNRPLLHVIRKFDHAVEESNECVSRYVYTHANNIFEGKGKCLEIVIVKFSDNKMFLSIVINSTSAIFTGI
ncbi:hypothetical protein ALC56_00766 [Trachymyrmex septentrionalis]|uniref:Uncharacterized protein n=1 Tax=Trachymyrmex septentrionalis TaxID=34720 RepID=A0A195FWG7_9HYME|nr:hypothetical protein ALC56_00766 [Trachymyrmex septentrionalis]